MRKYASRGEESTGRVKVSTDFNRNGGARVGGRVAVLEVII